MIQDPTLFQIIAGLTLKDWASLVAPAGLGGFAVGKIIKSQQSEEARETTTAKVLKVAAGAATGAAIGAAIGSAILPVGGTAVGAIIGGIAGGIGAWLA